jgi:hypothetical protein
LNLASTQKEDSVIKLTKDDVKIVLDGIMKNTNGSAKFLSLVTT